MWSWWGKRRLSFSRRVCSDLGRFVGNGRSRVGQVLIAAIVYGAHISTVTARRRTIAGFCAFGGIVVFGALYASRGVATVLGTVTDPLTRITLRWNEALVSFNSDF